ncbi:ABC transporter substrate-binding protein [Candidatus Micrarchaeota archaeon]|nr:ABC transporter substrate-binding protein [Candidatus Micrarchaeota archaeon]
MDTSKRNILVGVVFLAGIFITAIFFVNSSTPWGNLRGESSERLVTVKVAYLPVLQSLPLFVAVERGMFEKQGIRVELYRLESPNQIIDVLVSEKVDAGAPSVAAGITAIADLKKPGSLKIYSLTCGDLEHLNDELLVAKNSSINSVAGLKGKRLGIIPGVQFSTVAKKILSENNVNPSEVTLVELPVPNQLPSLASGSVDALLTLEPTGTLGESKNISRILVRNPMVRFVSDPWCGAAGVVTSKFLTEKPAESQAFMRVMQQAIIATQQDNRTKAYLVKYLSLPEPVAQKTPLPVFITSENIDSRTVEAYQEFADVFYEFNVTASRPNISRLLVSVKNSG